MKFSKDFYKNLLDNLFDGVYLVDAEKKITYWNKGAEKITGYKASEVVGKRCQDNILVHVSEEGISLCETEFCPAEKAMRGGGLQEIEAYLHHKNGHWVPVLIRASPLKDSDGNIIGAIEIFSDNSSQVAARQKIEVLRKMALLDPLTGVGNRRYAEANLNSKLNQLKRYGWNFGMLFIDIDNFKRINDVYGHLVGDEILKMVAKTFVNSLRSFDIVCRWGGDEFIAIIVNVNEEQLHSIANKLSLLVEKAILSAGSDIIRVSISVGATLAQTTDTVDTLIKRADELMYRHKRLSQKGKNPNK